MNRRHFVYRSVACAGGLTLVPVLGPGFAAQKKLPFMISLAEWSLHRAVLGKKLDHLDFPKTAKQDYGLEAIELSSQLFADKIKDHAYLTEFKRRADDAGVKILLIMVDGEGALGDPDEAKRKQAVENHSKWIDAAKLYNCHSIRVNAETPGTGTPDEQADRAADGLRQLTAFAAKNGVNVIVENHGGLSSNGAWLAGVMKKVNLSTCGTLPDFGNFELGNGQQYDRYQGVAEMMPYAKAVSAKAMDFDAEGNETRTDYRRMIKIVLESNYRGFLGIEYEGEQLSEPDGIRATKRLLEKVRAEVDVAAGANLRSPAQAPV